jgi:hypothetical protein
MQYTREEFQEILEKHQMWLNREDGGKRANLRGVYMQGVYMPEVYMPEVYMPEVNMQKADMRGADMRGADMQGADMRGADMQGVDMRGADMQGADMRGVNMRKADMRGVNMRKADMRGVNIDFSCWPLWCGSFDIKVDKRIAAQLAYHFDRLDCDDPEVIAAQNALAPLANQFHRVGECGRILVKPVPDAR